MQVRLQAAWDGEGSLDGVDAGRVTNSREMQCITNCQVSSAAGGLAVSLHSKQGHQC